MDENPYQAPQATPLKPLQKRVIIATVVIVVLFGIGFYLRGLPVIRLLWP